MTESGIQHDLHKQETKIMQLKDDDVFSLRFHITGFIKYKKQTNDLVILICRRSVGLRNLIRFLEK